MVYILLILVIIQVAIFGYILWDLKSDVEFLEDYICYIGDSVSNHETEIKILKGENDDQSQSNDFWWRNR